MNKRASLWAASLDLAASVWPNFVFSRRVAPGFAWASPRGANALDDVGNIHVTIYSA